MNMEWANPMIYIARKDMRNEPTHMTPYVGRHIIKMTTYETSTERAQKLKHYTKTVKVN